MSIVLRNGYFHYHFQVKGTLYQGSTLCTDREHAEVVEACLKDLAKRGVEIHTLQRPRLDYSSFDARPFGRKYQARLFYERRHAWIEEHGGRCVKCGSTESLEMDHIDPSQKKIEAARALIMHDKEAAAVELAKCQVLCEKCHYAKSAIERTIREHGQRSMYKSGCRCQPCKRANADHAVRLRTKRKIHGILLEVISELSA